MKEEEEEEEEEKEEEEEEEEEFEKNLKIIELIFTIDISNFPSIISAPVWVLGGGWISPPPAFSMQFWSPPW